MTSGPVSDTSNPVTARAALRVGQLLREKWRLDRLLGVGGMAAVYVGTHRNGMRGAVKLMHADVGWNDELRARFLREGYAANRVDHPGAVRVLDDDVAEDGSVFLVMELLDGETLEARSAARAGARLEISEVLAIADELLDVLAAAHDKGIVHRDIKPENIFFTRQSQVKVLDFGIARMRDASSPTNVTTTGAVMGTPAYMPPEQALGNWAEVDARTDLWAVGATMFALLTGRYVHDADTLQKMMLAAMTLPAPRLGAVRPDVPPEIAHVVDVALAFEKTRRWPDARAMQLAVRAQLARFGGAPARSSLPSFGAAPAVQSSPLLAEAATAPNAVAFRDPHGSAATGTVVGVVASFSEGARAPGPRASKAPMIVAILGIATALLGVVLWTALRGGRASVVQITSTEPAPPALISAAAGSVASPSEPAVTAEPAPPPSPPISASARAVPPVKHVPSGKGSISGATSGGDPFARQH